MIWPKTYKLRENSVSIPIELIMLLEWQSGDQIQLEYHGKDKGVTLRKSDDQGEKQ